MKVMLYPCWGLMLILFCCSCGNNTTDSVKNAIAANNTKIDSQKTVERPVDSIAIKATKTDAEFLVKAASRDITDAQLGQLAQTHAKNPRVKSFGVMMVNDDSMHVKQMRSLASTTNVALPSTVSADQQKEIADLQKRSGADFDKAFIGKMVDEYKDDLNAFEKQATTGSPPIATFANNSLDMLHRHFDSARAIRRALALAAVVGTSPPYQ